MSASDPEAAAAPFEPRAFLAAARGGHAVALGIGYLDHGEDWCTLTLPYDRRLVSDAMSGVLASGPIVSLIDTATTFAVWLRRGAMRPHATLDLRVDYLRPARAGAAVSARAECYRLTRRVAFVRAIAFDGGPDDPVAHAAGTYMLLDSWR